VITAITTSITPLGHKYKSILEETRMKAIDNGEEPEQFLPEGATWPDETLRVRQAQIGAD
jgi:hypothetical protein